MPTARDPSLASLPGAKLGRPAGEALGAMVKGAAARGAREPATELTVVVRVETPNPLNGSHGHPMAAARRSKRQLQATLDALYAAQLEGRAKPEDFASGCVVTMRRVCPGRGLASDALPAALKHVRDGIAQFLLGGSPGQMDDDPRIEWKYEQARLGKAKGVIISMRTR